MPSFKFDPRDFIGPPYSRCSKCQKNSLGILTIGKRRVTRRCRECMTDAHEGLPDLDKKVVYLDQFVISNITKTLNPSAPGHDRAKQNPLWEEIYGLLDVLVRAQVLICPHFENHRTESIYSPFYPALKWLYDRLSGGAGLHGSEHIKRHQLAEAALAWHTNREPNFTMTAEQAISGRFNVWLDNIQIVIKGAYPDDLEVMRVAREQGHKNLTETFERWRTEKDRRFEDWYEEERRAFGEAYLYIYQDWIKRFVRLNLGLEPFSLNAALPPEAVSTISLLADFLQVHVWQCRLCRQQGHRRRVVEDCGSVSTAADTEANQAQAAVEPHVRPNAGHRAPGLAEPHLSRLDMHHFTRRLVDLAFDDLVDPDMHGGCTLLTACRPGRPRRVVHVDHLKHQDG